MWEEFRQYVTVLWGSTHAEVNLSKVAMEHCLITQQRGSSRGFTAFLLNAFLRDTSGGLFLYH